MAQPDKFDGAKQGLEKITRDFYMLSLSQGALYGNFWRSLEGSRILPQKPNLVNELILNIVSFGVHLIFFHFRAEAKAKTTTIQ